MIARRTFVNEIGNSIAVSVVTGDRDKRVGISIKGPTSTSTNLVTRREAEEIYSALGEALQP